MNCIMFCCYGDVITGVTAGALCSRTPQFMQRTNSEEDCSAMLAVVSRLAEPEQSSRVQLLLMLERLCQLILYHAGRDENPPLRHTMWKIFTHLFTPLCTEPCSPGNTVQNAVWCPASRDHTVGRFVNSPVRAQHHDTGR